MKTLNKVLVVLFLGCLAKSAHAAAYAIAPKDTICYQFSTTVSTIAIGPGALYEVTLSSGAASEYVVTYDSNTYIGLTAANMALNTNPGAVTGRLIFGSTTANTQIRFDPPLHFFNGLYTVDSATTGAACYTYEIGRGLSGN